MYCQGELPKVQAGLEKVDESEIKLPIRWISEKAREFQKNIFCFINYAEVFDYVDYN